MVGTLDSQGSKWHRWDPHIHTPGTLLNDQYKGDWEGFLGAIESSDPPIRALGITDYYTIDSYREALNYKKAGRLGGVDLIFPNIELRYGIGTDRGSPINLHLLVSPDDADHVEQTQRFLSELTFAAFDELFRCERSDLILLGQKHDRTLKDERAALEAGANQFKVSPERLREAFTKSAWARDNILVAVVPGSKDGTAGLKKDSSLETLRKEIERSAQVIFSGQENQRKFWLGQGSVSLERLISEWDGCKPCLHGSDAHSVEKVGVPDLRRYCWIKGDLTFESLQQTVLEPELRTFIGPTAPQGALPSQVITSANLTNAAWLKTSPVPINSGFVCVIGARGSGKTALVDIIAAGAYALAGHLSERSFAKRAMEHLTNSTAELKWEDGSETSCEMREIDEAWEEPRLQYLSQQFVDILCSAEGVTDRLLAEIERVIFFSYPEEDRMGTTTFRDLREARTSSVQMLRRSHEESLREINGQLLVEWQRLASLPLLKKQRDERAASIQKDKTDRSKLIGKRSDNLAKELDAVSKAAENIRLRIQQYERQRQNLTGLRDEAVDIQKNKAPLRLQQLQANYRESGLSADEWKAFLLQFAGNIDNILKSHLGAVQKQISLLLGLKTDDPGPSKDEKAPSASFLPVGADLEKQPLRLLEKEIARLRNLIGIDAQNTAALRRLSLKITQDENALAKLAREIEEATKATQRMADLVQSRQAIYGQIFDDVIAEESELKALYAPLERRLAGEKGALQKLTFSVQRSVDVTTWSKTGEELLDLRKLGAFKGQGLLREAAIADLQPAWETGASADICAAIAQFRSKYETGLLAQSPFDRKQTDEFREWWGRVTAWLYSADHIGLTYSIQYEGCDIEQLSPGTRGIVLLLLYLAIDREDDRPLIIDQPEENLDPKSIFDELVQHFRGAKLRRQIIVVTHNANLVINGDADQVIVASCGLHRPGTLPEITYKSGGLENPEIRRDACDILEGGEAAFKERARRLRVRI